MVVDDGVSTSTERGSSAVERDTAIQAWMENRRREDDRLYERYGEPLEKEHWGSLVAIGPEGDVMFGDDADRLFMDAMARFGSGNFAFTRVGERVLGEWLLL